MKKPNRNQLQRTHVVAVHIGRRRRKSNELPLIHIISSQAAGARAIGKIVTSLPSSCNSHPQRRHRPIAASHLHSLNSHHHVSRCITRRPAAIGVHPPPRGHAQCLDNVRSRRRCKGQSCGGILESIRRPHQGHQLGQLGCITRRLGCEQCGQCDNGPCRRIGWACARSVASSRGLEWAAVASWASGRARKGGRKQYASQWHVWEAVCSCPHVA